MCLWEDEAALARFKAHSPIARAWRERTDEYCEVLMRPYRTHGSYRGHEPLAGLPAQRPGDGPAVMWTFANIAPRNLWFFWNGIRRATPVLLGSPGLIAGTAGPEHMYRGAMTFTIWERPEAALDFAYRKPPHRQIVKDVRARQPPDRLDVHPLPAVRGQRQVAPLQPLRRRLRRACRTAQALCASANPGRGHSTDASFPAPESVM